MPGLSSILDIGRWALFASQTSIEVTGNNISNVNTPGYSRQSVRLEEGYSIDYAPGQIGTGVRAKEVIRHFNDFIEEQYNTKASLRERWNTLQSELSDVELIFNEADGGGLGEALSAFWADWQDLTMRPEDGNARSVLLNNASTLTSTINMTMDDLQQFQNRTNELIAQEVGEVNDLISRITDLNKQIGTHEIPGVNNPNALLDERASLVRQLGEKIDIEVIDSGSGKLTILTKAGHTLVDGKDQDNLFSLAFEGPRTVQELMPGSTFQGQLYYQGESDNEYTFEIASDGAVGGSPPATFRVSVDGGKTWLADANGNQEFEAQEYGQRILLPSGELSVWFGSQTDPQASPTGTLTQGDKLTVVPKRGLYWYENTSSSMNVTPLGYSGGGEDSRRVTGGTLSGLFHLRDTYIGRYKDKLDAFSESIAWEVNRLHTQGVGLSRISDVTSSERVFDQTVAMGSAGSGLSLGDRLQAGNISMYVYNSSTGALVDSPSISFDPATGSLQSLAGDLDALANISASVTSDNRLHLQSDAGYEIAFGTDTTGVLAGLGINTFFDGTSARDIRLGSLVESNISYIAAGHVNGAGEANPGDNTTALSIAGLRNNAVDVHTVHEGNSSMTLDDFYNSLVGNVGADTAMAKFNHEYQKSMADDLNARQEEIAGVNLDEEMSNLIKFQHSYNAAAKLILTADKLMQTLLGMKQ